MNAPSLFYNKTLLDSLGITVKDNMTIDEFEAVAREVYEKSGVKTDLPYSAGDNYLPYAMRSHDVVKLFNEDSLNVTDAAIWYRASRFMKMVSRTDGSSAQMFTLN